jgi:branched-chain amino acid transport system substrate-binding protein
MARVGKVALTSGLVLGIVPATQISATTVPDADINAWALEYTGGTAGEASGDPVRIGYANAEAVVPESTVGVEAAVEYVNAELGGVQGRPIELVECQISTPEDGARCGAQFANDDSIVMVLTGAIVFGNGEFYGALNGTRPVLIGTGGTIEDFTTTAGVSYTAGATGVVLGLAQFVIEELEPETVAVVATDNPAGRAGAEVLLEPTYAAAGIDVSIVYVSETATAPEIASAMQAAGADTADVFAPGVGIAQCINTYDAIRSLGIDPVVVTTGLCYGTPMTEHMHDLGEEGDFPDGWYFGGYGASYFRPDYESGMLTYVTKVHEYGETIGDAEVIEYTGLAGPTFANLLTAVQFLNALGPDVDAQTLFDHMLAFEGPMMIQSGPIECGVPPFVAACGHQMGIERYLDGEWLSIRDDLNDHPIIVEPIG